jgi:hypothetical protein
MSSIPSQFAYHLLINNIAPLLASSVTAACSTYFTPSRETIIKTMQEIDDEREVDLLQMEYLLKWMRLVFDTETETEANAETVINTEKEKTQSTMYKKELFSIYRTICSDYKEYERWKKYNGTLWVMSSYRKKNVKPLARKILADIKLFHEGLKLFSMMKQVNGLT